MSVKVAFPRAGARSYLGGERVVVPLPAELRLKPRLVRDWQAWFYASVVMPLAILLRKAHLDHEEVLGVDLGVGNLVAGGGY